MDTWKITASYPLPSLFERCDAEIFYQKLGSIKTTAIEIKWSHRTAKAFICSRDTDPVDSDRYVRAVMNAGELMPFRIQLIQLTFTENSSRRIIELRTDNRKLPSIGVKREINSMCA